MTEDERQQAMARALSSPMRLRILRLCLHEPHTNLELAEALHLNPGTCLHHVRTLVAVGFLAPQEPRRGKRGAREIPYLSTRRTWNSPVPGLAPVVIETFLQEVSAVPPESVRVFRVGLKANAHTEERLMRRLRDVAEEFMNIVDEDGRPMSMMLTLHPEAVPAALTASEETPDGADPSTDAEPTADPQPSPSPE